VKEEQVYATTEKVVETQVISVAVKYIKSIQREIE